MRDIFILWCYEGVNSLIDVFLLTRLIITMQQDWGQLGLSRFPKATFSHVPFPVELHLPGVRVVSLAASTKSANPISSLEKTLPYLIIPMH